MLGGVEVSIEHSILLHQGSNSFGMVRGAKMSLASMKWNRLIFIQIQTLHRACTTSGKKVLLLYGKQTIENHKGPPPDEKSQRVEGKL